MPDTRTDQQLLDAAAAGDKGAFDALYDRHRDWTYALACRFVDRETAADVVQETFIYLMRKLRPERRPPAGSSSGAGERRLPPGSSSQHSTAGSPVHLTARMTTFLYPVVKNSALAIKRKQRRYVGPDEGLLELIPAGPAGVSAAAARLDGDHTLAALLEAVRRLPVGQQEVLLMRVVDEMSVAEVAAALQIPEGTVKSRLHLAVGGLRRDERVRGLAEEPADRPPNPGQEHR